MKYTISNIISTYIGCTDYLEEPLLTLVGATVLAEELESPTLRLVALAGEVLEGLLTGGELLTTHNTPMLVLDEVLLGEAAGGVLGSSVVNLGLGSSGNFKFGHLILLTAIFNWGRRKERRIWKDSVESSDASAQFVSADSEPQWILEPGPTGEKHRVQSCVSRTPGCYRRPYPDQ